VAHGIAGGLEALARPTLGGKAYEGFKIAPSLPTARDSRAAVKLTYLMTDDTAHRSPNSQGMLQMMDDLPQKNVHNVVFRDGGEQNDSKIYYIQQGDNNANTVRNPQSSLAPGVGEVQSNNPKVFSQIVGWTLDHYPGRRKYLQLYTHGAGVFGVGCDENQTDLAGKKLPDDQQIWAMAMPDFAEGLRQGLKGRQLDLIYFRACLMGSVEALYELRGTTRYVLASEDVSASVQNSNFTMTKQFDDLAAADTEPAEVARQMAIQGLAKNPSRPDGSYSGYRTFAAIDVERLDELKTSINVLARTLTAMLPTQREAVVAAYDSVPTFTAKEKAQSYYEHARDLWAFTAALQKAFPQDKALQQAVAQVRNAQQAAMIHAKDSYGSAANGLSIFMPTSTDLRADKDHVQKFTTRGYARLRFTKDTAWDEFLVQLAAGDRLKRQ
jgi:hypothetical protein